MIQPTLIIFFVAFLFVILCHFWFWYTISLLVLLHYVAIVFILPFCFWYTMLLLVLLYYFTIFYNLILYYYTFFIYYVAIFCYIMLLFLVISCFCIVFVRPSMFTTVCGVWGHMEVSRPTIATAVTKPIGAWYNKHNSNMVYS